MSGASSQQWVRALREVEEPVGIMGVEEEDCQQKMLGNTIAGTLC